MAAFENLIDRLKAFKERCPKTADSHRCLAAFLWIMAVSSS